METDRKNSASLPSAAQTRTSSDHITGQMKTGALTTALLFAAILNFYASVTNASHTIVTAPDTAWQVCSGQCSFRFFPTSEFTVLEACRIGTSAPGRIIGRFDPPLDILSFTVLDVFACGAPPFLESGGTCHPARCGAAAGVRLRLVCLPPFQFFLEPGQPLESFQCIGPGPHEDQFVIRLSPLSGLPQDFNVITAVEPDKTTETLVARVFNAETEELIPNVDVRLELDVIANSGGHRHHDDDRPKGKFSSSSGQPTEEDTVLTGNTGASGLSFTFKAVPPVGGRMPAGDHTITATCTDRTCMPDGPTDIEVKIEGLIPIPLSESYAFIGAVPGRHVNNHFLAIQATFRIGTLAGLYQGKFPTNSILHLNDASLITGGLFDVGSTAWKPPHFEHCRGTEIDIRANDEAGAIPSTPKHIKEFENLATVVGADAIFEIPRDKDGNLLNNLRHFHVRLTGEKPQCP